MLHTNVGIEVSPLERRKAEQSDRNKEIIERSTHRAEKSVREQGHEGADHRFWFQREGVFSADPTFDKSVEAVRGRTSLPVKERVTLPDGTIQKVLGEAAMECVARGYFCAHCEERQPDDAVRRREQLHSLRSHGVQLPAGAEEGAHCVYCAAVLQIRGEAPVVHPDQMTADQRLLLAKLGA